LPIALFNEGFRSFTICDRPVVDYKATDPVKYFADPQNRDLGIIKQKRKPNIKLIVAPFPDLQRGTDQFFFNISLKAS